MSAVRRLAYGTLLRVWGPVAIFVALCVGGAAAYVAFGPQHYRARAEVLVSPVPAGDERYADLPVLRGSTAVATAARLATASALAESVRERLGLRETAADVLGHVHAHPAGKSSVLEIDATSSDRGVAVRLANSFADLLVAERTATMNAAIVDATTRVFEQLSTLSAASKAGPRGEALRARLAALHSLSRSSDPSARVLSHALRAETVRPPAVPIVLGALGGSLLLGGAAGLLAVRRRGAEYDQLVTDRLAAELEQRLADRIEALLREQERLVAKEAELAAREQSVAAREAKAPPPPAPELEERAHRLEEQARELDERAHTLEERLKSVTTRELELVRRAGDLASRQQALDAKAEELSALARELETRGEELAARAAELERRAQELEKRAAAPPPPPVAAPPPPPSPSEKVAQFPPRPGRWNLNELQHLVEERGAEFPDRQDDWVSYLFFLRSYAEPDGAVPASFDWLIEETFAELVAGEPASAG
jgi:capsular polysaccharide biosynthesis protein